MLQTSTLPELHSTLQLLHGHLTRLPHADLAPFLPGAFKALAHHALHLYATQPSEYSSTVRQALTKLDAFLLASAKDFPRKLLWARCRLHLLNVDVCLLRRNPDLHKAVEFQKAILEI